MTEHYRLAFNRPWIFQFGEIDIGVSGDIGGFLRPQIPLFSLMVKGGGIKREGIKLCFNLSFLCPLTGQRIGVCTFERKHTVLEHPQLVERLCVGGGKIDVPLACQMMDLRCPDQLAHGAVFWFAPDDNRSGGA